MFYGRYYFLPVVKGLGLLLLIRGSSHCQVERYECAFWKSYIFYTWKCHRIERNIVPWYLVWVIGSNDFSDFFSTSFE